jgi:MoaA/NifB/PqqE/SkfB family radical SAM enzyme
MHNREWLGKEEKNIHERVEASRNGAELSSGPLYLDLRLGNLCNLKCRMCNGYNSTKIAAETEKLLETDPEFKRVYSQFLEPVAVKIPKWYEDEEFWQGVKQQVPFLRKVYLTGGEPTLIKKNYEFLKYCIDTGHCKHIFLMFNINGTHVPEEFIELLQHFEFVLLNVSLDGVGEVNNYIRGGSDWAEVDKNMRFLLTKGKSIKIGITPTVQIYNVLSLVDLLAYVEELATFSLRNIDVDFLYVTDPKYLDIRNLPVSVKEKALEKISQYRKKSWAYVLANLNLANCLKSLEQALALPAVDDESLQNFFVYTKSLDRARNEEFSKSLPELYSSFQAEGLI